ncbi:hypothetical protein NBRC10512_001756 [Rhodotorula toruloides]|uniref:RHTO0S07e01596g1_1 n=2 Tax=Rhodotorula toruloides TaxID=5286 RepID=A0A061AYI1_RHOTO|nr:uncharacterized protein RHTO_02735 [Rhodotorula toruloides NP11]EMS25009.1 hypothetical protein RHTO_02735 [Rhodotorula toruloides NP11]CDR42579.1 RHTO0S07e01596g1_1 [Rhodotorula toruloides]
MTQDDVLVYRFLPRGGPSTLSPAELAQRTAALSKLVNPQVRTSRSASGWQRHEPVGQLPSTRTYEATLPSKLSPRAVSTNDVPARRERQLVDRTVEPFSHGQPPPRRQSPSPALAAQPSDQPTQGILRRRETTGVVGGWAPSLSSAGREKKKVRVESPRTSGARVAEEEKRRVDKGKGKASDVGAKELVPATPVKREEEKTARGDNLDLADGAIKRCIPYPYCHNPSTSVAVNMNHARQHPSRILHSFVDPSLDPLASNLTAATGAATNGATQSQYTLASQLPLDSPLTMSYLQPGRRGAWLIPVSAPLPILHTSPVRWFAQPPPPPSSPAPIPAERSIDWTDARLRTLWSFLTSLHESGSFGRL